MLGTHACHFPPSSFSFGLGHPSQTRPITTQLPTDATFSIHQLVGRTAVQISHPFLLWLRLRVTCSLQPSWTQPNTRHSHTSRCILLLMTRLSLILSYSIASVCIRRQSSVGTGTRQHVFATCLKAIPPLRLTRAVPSLGLDDGLLEVVYYLILCETTQ